MNSLVKENKHQQFIFWIGDRVAINSLNPKYTKFQAVINARKKSEAVKKTCYKYISQQWQGYKDILEEHFGHAMFGGKFRSNV